MMDKKSYLGYWAESYKTDLQTNILPFWLTHGLDTVNGGVYTCIDREGNLMDPTKSVWFQEDSPISATMHTTTLPGTRSGWMQPNPPSTSSKRIALIPTEECF